MAERLMPLRSAAAPCWPIMRRNPPTFDRRSSSMRLLGYITTDPINATTAQALAAQHGVDFRSVDPRDAPRLEREPIDLVVDWDFIPEDYRARLLNSTALKVAAIHGYGISDSLA